MHQHDREMIVPLHYRVWYQPTGKESLTVNICSKVAHWCAREVSYKHLFIYWLWMFLSMLGCTSQILDLQNVTFCLSTSKGHWKVGNASSYSMYSKRHLTPYKTAVYPSWSPFHTVLIPVNCRKTARVPSVWMQIRPRIDPGNDPGMRTK